MVYSEEEKAIAWLSACTAFDYREKVALLRACGDPALLIGRAEEFLNAAIKEERRALLPSFRQRKEDAEALFAELSKADCFVLTLASKDYPESLKWIDDPPLALFGMGNLELIAKRKFCIVGSRSTPVWAQQTAKHIAAELSEYFVIVTGLAEGGDCAAIEGALPSGNLISVLPCGLSECYPSAHYSLKERIGKEGLLLSEYPLKEQARSHSFFARNRILAGLSEGVLVVSAGERSGTFITAGKALDYGRDVFAFPHNIGSAQGVGCNELLKKGAAPVTEAEDILTYYGFERKRREAPELTEEEEKVLNILREEGELHAAIIAERAGVKVYEVAATLSSLEVKNLVAKAGGNRYCIVS